MNPKTTRLWLLVAAGLFAFIVIYQHRARKHVAGPLKPLPDLVATNITSILVSTQGQVLVRAELTNRTWQLTEPIADLASGAAIEFLLQGIQHLKAATYIPARDLKEPAKAQAEFGFVPEGISLLLHQGGQPLPRLKIGRRTNPGDQVFAQVAGDDGIFVLDTAWLDFIPRTANAWRDPALANLRTLIFDHIGVTNHGAFFGLERDINQVWHMVFPIQSRANNPRIEEGMAKLHNLRATQFVPDLPRPELEAMGLAPPELEVGFGRGATNVALLQFGKTNDAGQVYARRVGRNAIFAVPISMLSEWQNASIDDFRDPRLLSLTAPIEALEIRAQDIFSVQHQTNGSWQVLPQNFPADAGLVGELLSGLTNMLIAEFVAGVATAPVLPDYGLAPPVRCQILLFGPGFRADGTNALLANVSFGTSTNKNKEGKVYTRRADEEPIYAISTNAFARLPSASWQLRQRRIWNFSTNDIAGVTINHLGKNRQIIRRAPYKWSLAPGSQGSINDLAVEETVLGLAEVQAVTWSARGSQNRARLGFAPDGHRITIALKNGEKAAIEFGGEAPSGRQYAAVTLGADLWIFEFPAALYRHVLGFLTIPPAGP